MLVVVAMYEDNDQWHEVGGTVEGSSVPLPPIVRAFDMTGTNTPSMPPWLIKGLLCDSGVMQVTAAPKAGKTHLLTELAYCVATGRKFLDKFECKRGRVLYLNLELTHDQFANRPLEAVRRAMGITPGEYMGTLDVWSLRGAGASVRDLSEHIDLHSAEIGPIDLLIVDPIYLLQRGNENDNSETRDFLVGLQRLQDAAGGAAVAYSHHHAKGAAGGKSAQDRGSGAGAFARFFDALIDLTEIATESDEESSLYLESMARTNVDTGETYYPKAWRAEFVTRATATPQPMSLLFDYPLHVPDWHFDTCPLVGSAQANRKRGGKSTQDKAKVGRESMLSRMHRADDACREAGEPSNRSNIMLRYNELCKAEGVETVSAAAFNKYAKPSDTHPWHFEGSGLEARIVFED